MRADEKPGIEPRKRRIIAPTPGHPGLFESDYQRGGVVQYLDGRGMFRSGLPWGRCEPKTGIAAFDRLGPSHPASAGPLYQSDADPHANPRVLADQVESSSA